MAEMRLKASGSELKIISAIHLTSTQAQYDTCLFEFDGAWDGYSLRTAVFYSNPNNIKPMLLDEDNKCFIPWDSFSNSRYLYIGVYGSNGNSYLPTQFVEIMYQPGANIDNHNYPPTPGIYEQIITFMEEHAHGSITRDGKIGTVANRFLVTGSGGAVGVKTPQQVVDLVGVSNPNILHNWDFRNLINQRGAVEFKNEYGIDRWREYGGIGVVVDSNNKCLRIKTGALIFQRIEHLSLAGKTVTASVMLSNGDINKNTFTFPSTHGQSSIMNIPNFGVVSLVNYSGSTTPSLSFEVKATLADMQVQAVKLELGTNSTLHLDPPMDHAVELPKCQRFFVKFSASEELTLPVYNPVYTYAYQVVFPTRMRVVPTVTLISNYSGGTRNAVAELSSSFNYIQDIPLTDFNVCKTHFNLTSINKFTANTLLKFSYEASADL